MKRLLCIVSSMDRGGAETFLMKIYRSLDHTKYQMDFCVSNPKKGFYDDEINKMGGKIYLVSLKSKHPIKSFREISKIVRKGKYEAVLRTSQQSLATIDLIAAKLGGAKKLIYRSSNANITGNFAKKMINYLFSFLPKIIPNVKIAPSTEAAEFVFGKKAVKLGKVQILPNGLDYDKFQFDEKIRINTRNELSISENLVFGHIGRFNIQKNHKFLIQIFKEIYEKNQNAVLLLIGEGELETEIKELVSNLNLTSNVKFLGPQSDVTKYLMAIDLMIFPSFFEGMPNVIIEAQASGLKCVLSDTITKEANITGLLEYVSLDESAEHWAEIILKNTQYKRKNYEKEFKKNGYLIQDVVNNFLDIVFREGD